jgi:hypothetical protein
MLPADGFPMAEGPELRCGATFYQVPTVVWARISECKNFRMQEFANARISECPCGRIGLVWTA